MKIRNARLFDANIIFDIGNSVKEFKVSDKASSFWSREILKNCVNSKTDFLLIAEDNKDIIGFIIANYNPNFKKAIIENIFVKPEFKDRDIGKRLLKFLLDKLKKIKCEYVCALVDTNGKPAINFYLKEGFNKGMNCVWFDRVFK